MNDDLDTIRRVLAADVESFRRLVERYQRPPLTLIRNLTPPDADREGVAQEVFLGAFLSLASFEPKRSAFSTWLFCSSTGGSCRASRRRGRASGPRLKWSRGNYSRKPTPAAAIGFSSPPIRSRYRTTPRRRCRTGCVSCWATTGAIRATAARSTSWPLATCSATYSTGTGQPRRGPGSASLPNKRVPRRLILQRRFRLCCVSIRGACFVRVGVCSRLRTRALWQGCRACSYDASPDYSSAPP
jgi:hypothetical protein